MSTRRQTMSRYTALAARLDDVSTEAGTITGTAVRYGRRIERAPDLYEEVQAGAFRAQVGQPHRVAVLYQHQWEQPIGRVTALDDSDTELRFTARIIDHEDVPEARRALALLREGVIDEMSVGFSWRRWSDVVDGPARIVLHTQATLRELSLVTFGALGRDARVLTVAADTGLVVDPQAVRARLHALDA